MNIKEEIIEFLKKEILKKLPALDLSEASIVKICKLFKKNVNSYNIKMFPYPTEKEAWKYAGQVYKKVKKRSLKKRKVDYKTYIKSEEWKVKREKFKEYKKHTCERCGSVNNLQVHHKHYETLGRESFKDLELLCGNCHMKEHGIERKQ